MELIVDQERATESWMAYNGQTGILVRAKTAGGSYANYDIIQLTKASLLQWLTSREGSNKLAENVVGVLLGHGHLHEDPQ